MTVLVCGGAGFIGSAYVRLRLDRHPGETVRVLDKLTYAGRWENLDGADSERLQLVEGDVADRDAVAAAIEGADAIVNFAAESHVDRSLEAPGEFIQTDVYGTFHVRARAYAGRPTGSACPHSIHSTPSPDWHDGQRDMTPWSP